MDLSKYKADTLHILYERDKAYLILQKILNYLHYITPIYFYIHFDDNSPCSWAYTERYPELENRYGFIKLKHEDSYNAKMIGELLPEYHEASLYVCQQPDLVELYGQNNPPYLDKILQGGYNLTFYEDELYLCKSSNIKYWNLLSLDIDLDNILICEDGNKEKSIAYIIDSRANARVILEIIDSIFTENKLTPLTQNTNFEVNDTEYGSSIIITSNLDIGVNPKIVIEGNCVDVYIFSNHKIITIKDINDEIEIAILKQCIKFLFFYQMQITYENRRLSSVNFINKDGQVAETINLPGNIFDRMLSVFSKKEIFEYKPIYQPF